MLPSGFAFEIKEVTDPAYGTLQKREEGVYLYTPDAANRDSGTIYVTVALKKQDGAFEAEDVTFAVELRQKQKTPEMLERTVYTYAPGNMYDSVEEAAENGFAGYESAFTEDNENRVQNGNAEIWEPDPGENAIMVVQGKFRADGGGRYRVALRGRRKAGLYLSFDGENYSLAALVNQSDQRRGLYGGGGELYRLRTVRRAVGVLPRRAARDVPRQFYRRRPGQIRRRHRAGELSQRVPLLL